MPLGMWSGSTEKKAKQAYVDKQLAQSYEIHMIKKATPKPGQGFKR